MEEFQTKAELMEDLVKLNSEYLVIKASFRVKRTDGYLHVMELFPNDCHCYHGFFDAELIFELFFASDIDIHQFIKQIGFYDATMLFKIEADGDGFCTWNWLELEHLHVDNFQPIESKLDEEFNWYELTTGSSKQDNNNFNDDLPF